MRSTVIALLIAGCSAQPTLALFCDDATRILEEGQEYEASLPRITSQAEAIVTLADSFDEASVGVVEVEAAKVLVDIERLRSGGTSVSTFEMVEAVNRACGSNLPSVGIQS